MSRATRTEVAVCLLAVGILLVMGYRVMGRQARARTATQCAANIKEINHAFHRWIEDVEVNRAPWRLSTNDGGNRDFFDQAARAGAWFQFATFSNQLASPSVLADPADHRKGLKRAQTWAEFASVPFQNNACSYGLTPDDWESVPRSQRIRDERRVWLLDRHVSKGSPYTRCVSSIPRVIGYGPAEIAWTRDLHGSDGGYAGFDDGSVNYMNSIILRDELSDQIDGTDQKLHFLFPDQ